jgi:hypothetical protein
MRWFFSQSAPAVDRLLFVESGPRGVAEAVLPRIRKLFGDDVPIDLLTCLRTNPKGLNNDGLSVDGLGNDGQGNGGLNNHGAGLNAAQRQDARPPKVWRVTDCPDTDSRWELLWRIRYERHAVTAIICSGSPIMMAWKLATLALLPSKFLIINENADFFWLDRSQLSALTNLLTQRAGLQQDLAVRIIGRAILFPLTLVYLLGFAACVHGRRLVRMRLGL